MQRLPSVWLEIKMYSSICAGQLPTGRPSEEVIWHLEPQSSICKQMLAIEMLI